MKQQMDLCPACGKGVHGQDALCPHHYAEYLGQHRGSHSDIPDDGQTRYTPQQKATATGNPGLTSREQWIVLATIRLWNLNAKNNGYVPDYHLQEASSFDLTVDEMRAIRSSVQSVWKPS